MTSKPIWFPFYPSDFLTSNRVALMTTEEIGGYTLLLCYAWQDPTCTLPADDEAIRKLSRLTGSLEAIKSCFIQKRGRLLNERLYKEWQKVKEKSELAKRSNAVRWENERNANAKRTQSSSHRNIGTEEHRNKRTEEHLNIRTSEELEKEIKTSSAVTPRGASKSSAVFDSYRNAYVDRYGVEPVRDKQMNVAMCQLIEKLGAAEAPHVAAFYLTHNDPFYVKKRHPPNLLVLDATGLRTQWATGVRATTSEARNAEMKDDVLEQVKRVRALMTAQEVK